MTKFKNTVNEFGNSPGDSLTENRTRWGGRGGFPSGKLEKYPAATGNISGGNRKLAAAKYGDGGHQHPVHGTNAFTRGKKK